MFTRALHRLFFIFMILLIPATLGLSLILFTPAYSWFFFGERRFLKYSRYRVPGFRQAISHKESSYPLPSHSNTL